MILSEWEFVLGSVFSIVFFGGVKCDPEIPPVVCCVRVVLQLRAFNPISSKLYFGTHVPRHTPLVAATGGASKRGTHLQLVVQVNEMSKAVFTRGSEWGNCYC